MLRHFRGFLALFTAVLALPVVVVVVLFLIQLSGELVTVLEPAVDPIAGVGPGAIIDGMGNAWMLFAISPLAIVGAVALYLYLGGGGSLTSRRQSGSDDRDSMPPY